MNQFSVTFCLAACLAAGGARAAGRQTSLEGHSLAIDSPCARQVTISADDALHDRITVQADADHQEEIDHLLMEGGGSARIRTRPGSCWPPNDPQFKPTLSLSVHVPPATALAIAESGVSRYTIAPVGGALRLELSGVADISAASAAALAIDLSGSGNVRLARADGPATVNISGTGAVQVGQASMPKATVELSGMGSLTIDSGQLGSVTVESSGVGRVRIGAAVENAKVELSGAGSVHFSSVSGTLDKDVSGLGDVSVGK